MKRWPIVQFRDLLTRVKDDVSIDDLTAYSRITIRMNGNGVVLRDMVNGSEIGTKRQFIARVGQFVLSKIDARNGAFGIVPPECDNAIVTGNFWVFEFDLDRVIPSYFSYLSRTPVFIDACIRASDGTTNRRYLQEDAFLRMETRLPSIPEQKILVTRFGSLTDKVQQVNAHLDAIESDAEQLLAIQFQKAITGAPCRPINDVAPLVRRKILIDSNASYTELGVRSFYKGTFQRRTVTGSEFTWQEIYQVQQGDLIFSNIMSWEKAIALAKPQDDGCVGNHRMLTCEVDENLAIPEFLWYYFTTPEGFAKIYAASPGTVARNRTMTSAALMDIEVPVPPVENQRTFAQLHSQLVELKAHHASIRNASQAIIPAALERIFSKA